MVKIMREPVSPWFGFRTILAYSMLLINPFICSGEVFGFTIFSSFTNVWYHCIMIFTLHCVGITECYTIILFWILVMVCTIGRYYPSQMSADKHFFWPASWTVGFSPRFKNSGHVFPTKMASHDQCFANRRDTKILSPDQKFLTVDLNQRFMKRTEKMPLSTEVWDG